MLVLAHDAPTNNEYVSNGVNGILFNTHVSHAPVQFRHDAARMARVAWQTVVEGRRQWLASHSKIIDWIEGARPGSTFDMDVESFFRDLWHSYYASLEEYERFLGRHLGVLASLSSLPLAKILDRVGAASSGGDDQPDEPRLDENGVLDLTFRNDRFIGSGWSSAEPEWRWAIGTSSELDFSRPEVSSERIVGRFVAASLPDLGKWVKCDISINEAPVFEGRIQPDWDEYEFVFDADLLGDKNHMTLTFDKAGATPADAREMSVRFKHFQFSDPLVSSTFQRSPALAPSAGRGRSTRAMLRNFLNRK